MVRKTLKWSRILGGGKYYKQTKNEIIKYSYTALNNLCEGNNSTRVSSSSNADSEQGVGA